MKLPAIPYMGSKRSIAEDIVKLIRIKHPNAKYFYDVFGGGGAVSIQALRQGFSVHYNELDERVCNLMKFLVDLKGTGLPKEWWGWVSREKFKEITQSNRKDAYAGMVQCCWSFGNNVKKGYLFGKNIERQKELLHYFIVNQSKDAQRLLKEEFDLDFAIPKEENIYDRYLLEYKPQIRKRCDFKLLEHLEQLERIQHLERIQQLQHLVITNKSYDEIKITTPLEETIVYCDPPYRGTTKYVSGEFDFKKFDEWFRNLPCTGILSEYNSPHKEVEMIRIIKRSLMAQGGTEIKYKHEKIYWNGK